MRLKMDQQPPKCLKQTFFGDLPVARPGALGIPGSVHKPPYHSDILAPPSLPHQYHSVPVHSCPGGHRQPADGLHWEVVGFTGRWWLF